MNLIDQPTLSPDGLVQLFVLALLNQVGQNLHTLEEAFMWMWLLQRACDIQIAAASGGRLRRLSDTVLAQTRLEAAGEQPEVCKAVFDALVRKVDAIDPAYRD